MIETILFVTGIVTLILGIYACFHVKTRNIEIEKDNQLIQNEHDRLQKIQYDLLNQIEELREKELAKQEQINIKIKEYDDILKRQQSLSQNAFANYCDILDNDYKNKEKEYDNLINNMKLSYEKQQLNALKEWENVKADLDKIKATRAATIQARIQEEKIKEQREFYMLCPKTTEIDDIKKLEKIKTDLHNPRILSMLIWSTFFQKPMTTLCNNILGTATVTGIYKITNQENDMCYIGQAVDMATRWKNHAKCGLGIDTPAGNKLYKAMQEEGIWNFTWELIEECPSSQLNEKEQYYIDLYDSKNYGYNSNIGVSKK